MSRRPQGKGVSVPKARRWQFLARTSWKLPVRLEVEWKGGAEGWILVKARGESGVFPAHAALLDVLGEVLDGKEWWVGREPRS